MYHLKHCVSIVNREITDNRVSLGYVSNPKTTACNEMNSASNDVKIHNVMCTLLVSFYKNTRLIINHEA